MTATHAISQMIRTRYFKWLWGFNNQHVFIKVTLHFAFCRIIAKTFAET